MKALSKVLVRIFWLLALWGGGPVFAASGTNFKKAYAAANAAEKQAGLLRNQWIATEAALAEARKAAEKGDFGRAITAAKEAEALAKASVFQTTSEQEAWKKLEIR